jgi:adenylate cyclase
MHKLVVRNGASVVETFVLEDGRDQVLGRAVDVDLSFPSEDCLSRCHVSLRARSDAVEVTRLPSASNVVVFQGESKDWFVMQHGEFFVVGATTFHLDVGREPSGSTGEADPDERPDLQYTMDVDEFRSRKDRGDRMRLLDLMELPVVLRTKSRSEFFMYACGVLRLATGASWVQTVWMGEETPIVLAEDSDLDCRGPRGLSRTLMRSAIDEPQKPVTFCWSSGGSSESLEVTACENVGWAICCAMPVPGEEPVLYYVAGEGLPDRGTGMETMTSDDMSLRDTARMVGLVADMIGRAISMEKLERWKSRLGQFFSEKVVTEILDSDAEEALAPRITEATVMFFDIRGFSAKTEEQFSIREEENLERILDFTKARRAVLNVVSQRVIEHNGVIISYAGDGMLACWNVPKEIPDHAEQGCLAAVEMIEQIGDIPGEWRCGIGVGSGSIVAGSLGSDQKEQYDILGAVVNQSSRIEGITKVVGVPLLVTEATAKRLETKDLIARRIATFRPAGMKEEVVLYSVERAPESESELELLKTRFAAYAAGLEAFEKGSWDEAFKCLTAIATEDPAAKYLLGMAISGEAPQGWRGVIELTAK